MDLSIIIVSWNVRDLLRDNLKSIYKNTLGVNFEVFVIDNDSKDGTTDMIKKEFPEVKLIENKENLGFAKANNQGINKSTGRYVLLLNPDMQVLEGTLEKMVKWMDENKEVGAAGCHLVNEKGETVPHVRKFPTLIDQLAIVLKIPHISPGVLDNYLMKSFDYKREKEVDSIRGSFFMIRRETINKIGGLDERYFLWFEEVDYCKSIKNAGWKVVYTPDVECVDRVGRSFLQVDSGTTQKYFCSSMLKYFKKWHSPWQYKLLELVWPTGYFIAMVAEKLNMESKTNT